MPYIHVHNDEEYEMTVADAGDNLVIVKTSAEWCGPCKAIAPYFEELASEFKDVHFISLDVDECDDASVKLKIRALPTFIALRDRKELQRVMGVDRVKLKLLVEKHSQ